MKKKFMKLLSLTLSALMVLGAASGCNSKKAKDGDEHLEIYVLNVGYGYEWADEMAKEFIELDWVKEKYPQVSYSLSYNDDWDFATNRLEAGGTVNTADIMFSSNLQRLYNTTKDGNPVLTDLNDLMNEKVMGEDVYYKDKIYPDYLKVNVNPDTDHVMTVPWSSTMNAILYNQTIFESLGYEIPVTTDEFINVLKQVKDRTPDSVYGYDYAVIGCHNVNYWKNMFPVWWAQYEGLDGFNDYWNGVSEGKLSKDVFKQTGRLKALEAMDEILDGRNGYIDASSGVYEFMEAQTNFLMGKGIFYCCGDWFDYEMRKIAPGLKEHYDYNIRAMRTPVVSSIIEKTSIKNDAELAALIREIDAGKAYSQLTVSVSEKDYKTVKAARNIADFGGGLLNAAIPSYATASELAMDFLRFMATDRANEIYVSTTKGGSMGFIYDLEKNSPDAYEDITDMQKDKYALLNHKDVKFLPNGEAFPLCYKGGLLANKAIEYNSYEAVFGRTDDARKSAKELYEYDIEYYTDTRWNLLVSMSGVQ